MKSRTALFAVVSALACAPDDNYTTGPAWLGPADAIRIVAPDTAKAGVSFVVTITSYGSVSEQCNRPAGTRLTQSADVARIEVYHRYPVGEVVCASASRPFVDTVAVRFESAGIKSIRLVGAQRWINARSPLDSIEKRIEVRP